MTTNTTIKLSDAQQKALIALDEAEQEEHSTYRFRFLGDGWYAPAYQSGISGTTMKKLVSLGLVCARTPGAYAYKLSDEGFNFVLELTGTPIRKVLAQTNRDNLAQSADVEMNATSVPTQSIGNDEGGEIVTCARCGDEFDNTTDGYFFPIGDCATMPEQYTEKHYCDDCGGEIATQHGWFSNRKQRPSIGDAIRKHAEPVPDEPRISIEALAARNASNHITDALLNDNFNEQTVNEDTVTYAELWQALRVAREQLANARTTIDALVPTLIDTGKQQAEKIAALQAENARLWTFIRRIATTDADSLAPIPALTLVYEWKRTAKALQPTPIGVTDGAQ